jgi:hypothetical protein
MSLSRSSDDQVLVPLLNKKIGLTGTNYFWKGKFNWISCRGCCSFFDLFQHEIYTPFDIYSSSNSNLLHQFIIWRIWRIKYSMRSMFSKVSKSSAICLLEIFDYDIFLVSVDKMCVIWIRYSRLKLVWLPIIILSIKCSDDSLFD